LSSEGTAVASAAQTVTDAAGNVSVPSNVVTVKIDKTKPTLNPVVNPNPVILNGAATVTAGAVDALSGIAVQACDSVSTRTVGSQSVGCLATDKAGNTSVARATYTVIYRFDGFLQPINDTNHPLVCGSPCLASIFKSGSTVPAKFQLKDASGKVVQSVQAPIWVTPLKGNATSSAINESVFSDAPTSGTAYRLTGNQYVYNWGTKGFAAGFYWRIGVTLDDGQTYYVIVGLR
ncbi:MAG: PxKF domain-containing protein, partial [Anaerolineales bacterium]